MGAMQTGGVFVFKITTQTANSLQAERINPSSSSSERTASNQQAFFLKTTEKTLEILSHDLETEVICKLFAVGFDRLRNLLINSSAHVHTNFTTSVLSLEEIARALRENQENTSDFISDDNDESDADEIQETALQTNNAICEADIVSSEEEIMPPLETEEFSKEDEPSFADDIAVVQDTEVLSEDDAFVASDDISDDIIYEAEEEGWCTLDGTCYEASTRSNDDFSPSLDIDETMTLIKTAMFRLAKLIVVRSQYTHIPPIHVYKVLEALMNYPATDGLFSGSYMTENPLDKTLAFVSSAEMSIMEVVAEVDKENKAMLDKIGTKIAKESPSYYDISTWLEAVDSPVEVRRPGTKYR